MGGRHACAGRRQCRQASRRCRSRRSPQIAGKTGGPIAGHVAHQRRTAPAPSFATHIVRRRGRPRDRQGRRSCATPSIQDAGKAIHPSYVEGQYQGGAVQGIGWALNEEYIYGADGRLQNAGLPRLPHARSRSDLPMIDTVIVEVPNPAPSLRRARRRRDADRAAAGRDRQRGRQRHRRALHASCRCRRPRCSRRWTRLAPRGQQRSSPSTASTLHRPRHLTRTISHCSLCRTCATARSKISR